MCTLSVSLPITKCWIEPAFWKQTACAAEMLTESGEKVRLSLALMVTAAPVGAQRLDGAVVLPQATAPARASATSTNAGVRMGRPPFSMRYGVALHGGRRIRTCTGLPPAVFKTAALPVRSSPPRTRANLAPAPRPGQRISPPGLHEKVVLRQIAAMVTRALVASCGSLACSTRAKDWYINA